MGYFKTYKNPMGLKKTYANLEKPVLLSVSVIVGVRV